MEHSTIHTIFNQHVPYNFKPTSWVLGIYHKNKKKLPSIISTMGT